MSKEENGTKGTTVNTAVSNKIQKVPSSSINQELNKKGKNRKKTSSDQLELPLAMDSKGENQQGKMNVSAISPRKEEVDGNKKWQQGTPSEYPKRISHSNDDEDTNITELASLLGGMVASATRQPNVNRTIIDGLPAMAAALKALKKCRNDRRKAYAKLEELGATTPKKDRKRQRLYSENIDSGGSTPSQEAEIIEQQQQNEKTKSAVKRRLVKSRRPTQQKSEQGGNLTSKR